MMGAPVPRPGREEGEDGKTKHFRDEHNPSWRTQITAAAVAATVSEVSRLTLQLLFVLLTGCIVHAQGPPAELTSIQVPHSTECCFLVLILTKAIAFWLACLSVIYQSDSQNTEKYNCYI